MRMAEVKEIILFFLSDALVTGHICQNVWIKKKFENLFRIYLISEIKSICAKIDCFKMCWLTVLTLFFRKSFLCFLFLFLFFFLNSHWWAIKCKTESISYSVSLQQFSHLLVKRPNAGCHPSFVLQQITYFRKCFFSVCLQLQFTKTDNF